MADKVTAMAAAQAAVAALLARERGAGGQRVDVPMLDVSIAFLWMDMAGPQTLLDATADESQPVGGARRFFEFRDGWGVVSVTRAVDLARAAEALGVQADGDDPDVTREALRAAAQPLSMAEAGELLANAGVPFGLCRTLDDVHEDPQVVASELFAESEHPEGGRIREPRSPVRFSATPTSRPAPSAAPGQHTAEVLDELGQGSVRS